MIWGYKDIFKKPEIKFNNKTIKEILIESKPIKKEIVLEEEIDIDGENNK